MPSKTEFEKTQVECRSGHKANEYPVAFVFQGARLEVAEIVDRWYEGGVDPEQPVIDYFRVRSEEGRAFILKYSGHLDQWFIRGITVFTAFTCDEK